MEEINMNDKVWQDPAWFIAFGFGSGLMPFAPGTWGTLAAIPVFLCISATHWSIYALITVLLFALGVRVSDQVSKALGVHDYPGIVWDEVVGYLLTMFLVPVSAYTLLAGFILFRIFDIWKPFPIRVIDAKVQGGLGIMLDDVLAAIPAWILLQVLVWGFSL
jgi:phosphatidylglycerophosphatase A